VAVWVPAELEIPKRPRRPSLDELLLDVDMLPPLRKPEKRPAPRSPSQEKRMHDMRKMQQVVEQLAGELFDSRPRLLKSAWRAWSETYKHSVEMHGMTFLGSLELSGCLLPADIRVRLFPLSSTQFRLTLAWAAWSKAAASIKVDYAYDS